MGQRTRKSNTKQEPVSTRRKPAAARASALALERVPSSASRRGQGDRWTAGRAPGLDTRRTLGPAPGLDTRRTVGSAQGLDTRLTEIEIKLCYQEDTVEKLSQLIIRQQAELDRLGRRLGELEQHPGQTPTLERGAPEDPPPHY
jgi:SlyX protein